MRRLTINGMVVQFSYKRKMIKECGITRKIERNLFGGTRTEIHNRKGGGKW